MILLLALGCTSADPGKTTPPPDSGTQTDTATPPETGTTTTPCDPDATGIAAWRNDCDGDGFDWYSDCDDANGAINADAYEFCDGRDNNCDGQVDNVVAGYIQDSDGDGWGSEATYTDHCPGAGSGWIEDRGWGYDCDDTDPEINPDAMDTPGDGVDQDCIAGDACGTVTEYVEVNYDDASLAVVADLCAQHEELGALAAGLGGDVADLRPYGCFCRVDDDLYVSAADDTRSLAGIGALIPSNFVSISGNMTTMNGWDAPGDLEAGLDVPRGDLESFTGMEAVTGLNALFVGDDYGDPTTFPGLRDLTGLDGLQHVNYTLSLGELSALESLHGLESLEEVGYDLDLHPLPALTEFTGLSKLRRVGQSFRLPENGDFQSLEGLQALEEVGGLDIRNITLAEPDPGFSNLRLVGRLLLIGPYSPGLVSFQTLDWPSAWVTLWGTGFPDLTPMGSPESIEALELSDGAESLAGLEDLSVVAVQLDIEFAGYSDLEALSNLEEVGGDLVLAWLPNLTSLTALHGLTRVGGRIEITSNASLPDAEVEALLLAIGRENIGGTVTVHDNGG